jgi:ppGpp synthetase/RelA/SpoT-type nucleotidyltranferase
MTWAKPGYKKGRVNNAGAILIDKTLNSPETQESALDILNNWRSAHAFPLNTFQIQLRKLAVRVYPKAIIAQRLKRKASILNKLSRFDGMELARMQDIGGCRAVVMGMEAVKTIHSDFKRSKIKHKLVTEKNYIDRPKPSGYRGIHLVYRYKSDKNKTYNGLQIEIQLRTRVQHAWATAVEIIGIFIHHSLKSSIGPDKWLRFFALMSSAFAHDEKAPLVPGTPTTTAELKKEIRKLAKNLRVIQRLTSFGQTLKTIDIRKTKEAHFYLMYLKPMSGELEVKRYKKEESTKAALEYLEIEKSLHEDKGAEAVLVSVDSIEALKSAYPNYYLDTTRFLAYLKSYLRRR